MSVASSPSWGSKRFVVSIHDVAPPFEREIRAQLAALSSLGITRCVLKVVPDWHGAFPLAGAPSLVRLLETQCAAGSELVLHGLEHRRHGPLRGSLPLRLRADLFAGDAAEFLTLNPDEIARCVEQGRGVLAGSGLPAPVGFCAPGWLLPPNLDSVLTQKGIRYVIGMFVIRDLQQARRFLLPAFGHVGAGPWHEAGIQAGNYLAGKVLGTRPVMKVYLHPQGGVENWAVQRVLRRLERLLQDGWQPATYDEIMRDDAAAVRGNQPVKAPHADRSQLPGKISQ